MRWGVVWCVALDGRIKHAKQQRPHRRLTRAYDGTGRGEARCIETRGACGGVSWSGGGGITSSALALDCDGWHLRLSLHQECRYFSRIFRKFQLKEVCIGIFSRDASTTAAEPQCRPPFRRCRSASPRTLCPYRCACVHPTLATNRTARAYHRLARRDRVTSACTHPTSS